MKRALLVLWLTLLWLVLWQDLTAANLLSGLAVALLASAVWPLPPQAGRLHRVRPLALAAFTAYFAWRMLEANLILAREALTLDDTTRPGIIAVPLGDVSDLLATIVANAVTLTPGTLTLDMGTDPRTLYVHVLHLHDADRVRRDIRRFEQLALRAYGFDPAQADTGEAPGDQA